MGKEIFKPVRNKSLSKMVMESIKEVLIQKTLKPGDRLPTETELCESLGVGKSSVREAIKMLEVLGISPERAQERFGFLLEALKYGAPPHGGLAYGFDRLSMFLCGEDAIRDVIAFPKVQNASEPMSNAPDTVDDKQLEELHIKLDLPSKN